jgi:hypothetical protein
MASIPNLILVCCGSQLVASFAIAEEHRRSLISWNGGIIGEAGQAARDAVDMGIAISDAMEIMEQIPKDKLGPLTTPLELKGRSLEEINGMIALLIGVIFGVILVGGTLDYFNLGLQRYQEGRPKMWVLGTLALAYSCLIASLPTVFININLVANVKGTQINIIQKEDCTPVTITGSIFDIMSLFAESQHYLCLLGIIIYAIVLPIINVTLMTLGEIWRHSGDEKQGFARSCVVHGRILSKWHAPTMFIFIIALNLMSVLSEEKEFIIVNVRTDIGFSCFCMFCILAPFATIHIELPEPITWSGRRSKSEIAEHSHMAEFGEASVKFDTQVAGLIIKKFRKEGLLVIAGVLTAGFFICFGIGIVVPCTGIRYNVLKPKGFLPDTMEPLLDKAEVETPIELKFDMIRLLQGLLSKDKFEFGDVNGFLLFFSVMFFVLFLAAADVIVLFAIAAVLVANAHIPDAIFLAARGLKHLSMLDVYLMAMLLVCAGPVFVEPSLCFGEKSTKSLEALFVPGLFALLFAEAFHYILFHLVGGTVRILDTPPAMRRMFSEFDVAIDISDDALPPLRDFGPPALTRLRSESFM